MGEVYEKVNEAFRETFGIIFGECNLNLSDLEEYMWLYHYKPDRRKSSISGKDVMVTDTRYCEGARMVSYDEIDLTKNFQLDINEIKDIDSILSAISDRMEYAGNKVFGTSRFYEKTDNCNDSVYVYDSHEVDSCKKVGYSSYVRAGSENVFGSAYFLRSKYVIKCVGADGCTRGFESYFSIKSSDLFCSYYSVGCNNVMFSFNQRAKNHVIGNLELPRDKYLELKKKLVQESREYLEKHRTFPSLFDFPKPSPKLIGSVSIPRKEQPKTDLGKIEQAFAETSRIVLGKELSPMKKYEKFLSERVNRIIPIKTAFGGKTVNVDFFFLSHVPPERAVNLAEVREVAKLHLSFTDGEEVTLKNVWERLPSIAFYQVDMVEGESENNIETPVVYHAVNTYRVCDATYNKNCAYCTFALALDGRRGESQFGCYRTLYSRFCIRCHSCVNLNNCFEMESCTNCSNSMFCHNCEGLDNCMFCFNVKSKRYAVGNVELGRENYMKIKKMVLDEIHGYLERDGKLPFDIFTLGCYTSKKGEKEK